LERRAPGHDATAGDEPDAAEDDDASRKKDTTTGHRSRRTRDEAYAHCLTMLDRQAFLHLSTTLVLGAAGCGGLVESADGGLADGSARFDASSEAAHCESVSCIDRTSPSVCCPADAESADAPAQDAGPSGCPSTQPISGYTTCNNNELYCEYGSAPNPYCNHLFQCLVEVDHGPLTWFATIGSDVCPPPGTPCPASYAFITTDDPKCSNPGNTCEYPQGTCICTSDPGGLPVADGPVWSCTPLSEGCGYPRPHLGTPCHPPGPICDYGACSGGVDEECVNGYWAIAMVGCPK
jgi:hypothetical protein